MDKFRIIRDLTPNQYFQTASVISTFIYSEDINEKTKFEKLMDKYANISSCEKTLIDVANYLTNKYDCKPACDEEIIVRLAKRIQMEINSRNIVDFYIFKIDDIYVYMDLENDYYQIEADENDKKAKKLINEVIIHKGVSQEDISTRNHNFSLYVMAREGIPF